MNTDVIDIMRQQIGFGNICAISGGRVRAVTETMLRMPVSSGYHVEVELDEGSDTYTVRRVTIRKAKGVPVHKVKGEVTYVFADQVGEMAYQASCFRNVEFGS
jgi:hypothetical protein